MPSPNPPLKLAALVLADAVYPNDPDVKLRTLELELPTSCTLSPMGSKSGVFPPPSPVAVGPYPLISHAPLKIIPTRGKVAGSTADPKSWSILVYPAGSTEIAVALQPVALVYAPQIILVCIEE